jgi:hypothetical protein
MKGKVNLLFMRLFDLLLALGFIVVGAMMINSKYGIFSEGFPKEFSDALPFDSWFIPGIILIIVFGAGNLAAFVISFIRRDNPHRLSLIMGCILLLFIIMQVIILGEWYLASVEFIILGVIQIVLSATYKSFTLMGKYIKMDV